MPGWVQVLPLEMISLGIVLLIITTFAAPGTITSPAKPKPNAMQMWRDSIGYLYCQAVAGDMHNISLAVDNNDIPGLDAAGLELKMDTGSAMQNPPPGPQGANYIVMMGAYQQAGQDLTNSDLEGASHMLDVGNSLGGASSAC